MQTKKAMVSRIKNGHCMIVTDDGQFKNIPMPRNPVQVGQIIDYKEPSGLKWFKPLLMVASFFVVFFGLYAYQQSLPPGPLTYITLDINPSIQLGLNSADAVIEAVPLNDDGEKLLDKLDYKGRNYDVFLEDLVTEAANQGYLATNEENVIVASLYGHNNSPQEKTQELKVQRSIKHSLDQKKLKADVLVYKINKKVWQEAKKKGLSAGKLAFSKEMHTKGIEISQSELKKDSIKKIIRNKLRQKENPNNQVMSKEDFTSAKKLLDYNAVNPNNLTKFRDIPGQKGSIKKPQAPNSRNSKTPNPLKSKENPSPNSPDSEIIETVYDELTLPQEETKKPPQPKPERPTKKVIDKGNEKTKSKKPGN